MASLCSGGILGGAIFLEDSEMIFRTEKLTVPDDVRCMKIPYCDITGVFSERVFGFPAVEIFFAGKKVKFIVFLRKSFLSDLKSLCIC